MSKPSNITNKNKISKSPVRRIIKSKAIKAINTKWQLPATQLYAYPSRWSTDTDVSSTGTADNPQTNTKNQELEIPSLLSDPKISPENKPTEDKKPRARIVDLCEDDRKRILQLIEELVKYKEEKLSLKITVTKLNEQLRDKNNEIIEITEKFTNKEREMLKEAECLQSTIKELSSKNEVLIQTHELEKQVLEYRIRELAASAKSYKAEKEHIQTKMAHHSQKLKIAISTIDRLTSELKALRLSKDQIDKAAQVPEVKSDDCISGEVRGLLIEGRDTVTADHRKSCIQHVINVEEANMWNLDGIVEEVLELFVINLADDTDTNGNTNIKELTGAAGNACV